MLEKITLARPGDRPPENNVDLGGCRNVQHDVDSGSEYYPGAVCDKNRCLYSALHRHFYFCGHQKPLSPDLAGLHHFCRSAITSNRLSVNLYWIYSNPRTTMACACQLRQCGPHSNGGRIALWFIWNTNIPWYRAKKYRFHHYILSISGNGYSLSHQK